MVGVLFAYHAYAKQQTSQTKWVFVSEHHRLHAVTRIDFRQNVRHMRFHRRQADEKLVGNLLIRQSMRDLNKHFALAVGQVIQFRIGIC